MPNQTNKQDSIYELNQNLSILNNRISSIEKTNKEFELKLVSMEKKARYGSHSDSAEVNKLRDEAIEIKKKVKNISIYLGHLVNGLKRASKNEEVDILKRKISRFEPYGFATKKEANNIIKKAAEDKRNI